MQVKTVKEVFIDANIFLIRRRLEHANIDIMSAVSPGTIEIWDDTLWYKPDASRQDAAAFLRGRPEGTFLVRKSSNGELALSLTVAEGFVGHCIIYNYKNGVGYGFTRQSTHFPSVRALILYYSAHSLEEFNPQLQTCLCHPAFAPDPSAHLPSP